jgi:hypothetical protein
VYRNPGCGGVAGGDAAAKASAGGATCMMGKAAVTDAAVVVVAGAFLVVVLATCRNGRHPLCVRMERSETTANSRVTARPRTPATKKTSCADVVR